MAPGNSSDRALLTSDTSRDVERIQVALWRRMSPLEKADRALDEARDH